MRSNRSLVRANQLRASSMMEMGSRNVGEMVEVAKSLGQPELMEDRV